MNVCVHDCNTFKTILVVEFLLLILNLKKKILNFLAYRHLKNTALRNDRWSSYV